MNDLKNTINTVLKAVAVGLSISAIVFGFMDAADLDAQITLLALGLACLAVASLQKGAAKT